MTFSTTLRPSRPPWAFTSLAHRWYPLSNARPSAWKGSGLAAGPGLSESEAPMMIGPVGLLAGAAEVEVLALVQAASTLTPSTTATAPIPNLTEPNLAEFTPSVIPGETTRCRVNGMKIPWSASRGDQVTQNSLPSGSYS